VLEAAVVARPDEKMGRNALRFRDFKRKYKGHGRGSRRLPQGKYRPFQMPDIRRFQCIAIDFNRQSTKIYTPRENERDIGYKFVNTYS
jgi:hypothetical protein